MNKQADLTVFRLDLDPDPIVSCGTQKNEGGKNTDRRNDIFG